MNLEDLNLAGWLLVGMVVLASLGGGIPLMFLLMSWLPEGRYPRILFMAPMLVIAAVVFFVGRAILGLLGIRIMRSS